MSDEKFIIEVYSHGFHVTVPYVNHRYYVTQFCKDLTEYKWVWDPKVFKKVLKADKTYAVANPLMDTFGFLLGELTPFINHLKLRGFIDSDFRITYIECKEGDDIEFDLPGISPRNETQVKGIEFLTTKGKSTRVLPLPTGQGKTLTTLQALKIIKKRTLFTMNARHIITWVKTIKGKTDYKRGDIMIIQGVSSLVSLVNAARNGEIQAKFIIASSTTINNYLKAFLDATPSEDGVDFSPREMMEILGIGVEVIDECHEVIHQVIRRFIMMPVKLRIPLSATLTSDNQVINRVFGVAYPFVDRFTEFENNTHVEVHPYLFRFKNPTTMKYTGPHGYSHHVLESGILKNRKLTEDYTLFIYEALARDYLINRKPGSKALIFCASVHMCTHLTEYLKEKCDHIDTRRFVSGDPVEVLEEAELIVTTPGSCGTGKDIPNLMVTICTIGISSKQLQEQVMGRLRPIDLYPDEAPRFYYFVCEDIPKHVEYDTGHRRNFALKSKSVEPIQTFVYLGDMAA